MVKVILATLLLWSSLAGAGESPTNRGQNVFMFKCVATYGADLTLADAHDKCAEMLNLVRAADITNINQIPQARITAMKSNCLSSMPSPACPRWPQFSMIVGDTITVDDNQDYKIINVKGDLKPLRREN